MIPSLLTINFKYRQNTEEENESQDFIVKFIYFPKTKETIMMAVVTHRSVHPIQLGVEPGLLEQ